MPANSFAVQMDDSVVETNRTGKMPGMVTFQKRCNVPAPSTLAASYKSCPTVASPASRVIAKNGKPRHTLTRMAEAIAQVGLYSQGNGLLVKPALIKIKLSTLERGA